jgi:outer membrane immunogenic protein
VNNTLGGFGGGEACTKTFDGWTLGGGLEWMVARDWSFKVEYQHFDFGTENATLHTPVNGTFRYSNHLTANAVMVGVNFHFH